MIDSTAVRATRASSDGWPAPCDVYDITFRTEPNAFSSLPCEGCILAQAIQIICPLLRSLAALWLQLGARKQRPARPACGETTPIQSDRRPNGVGDGAVGGPKTVRSDGVFRPDPLIGLCQRRGVNWVTRVDRGDEYPAITRFIHHPPFM